jgi:cytochrome c nitrite reductase small subunit
MLKLLTIGLIGTALGLGSFTFIYARGLSYLTNDPHACANCHIMQEQFSAWERSSHHAVAVCNDCHTPHFFVGKYFTKGLNGFNHSWAFTLGRYPDPIQITARNNRVTEGTCHYCHADVVHVIEATSARIDCIRCHRSVGHLH